VNALTKTEECEKCGKWSDTTALHEDYTTYMARHRDTVALHGTAGGRGCNRPIP